VRPGSLHVAAATPSAAATGDLAAALAELAQPSDLILLSGDLGAGKTTFCQGFGRGLGIDEQITSPTFTLVRSYTGRLDLYHLDVYRLEQLEEVIDLGLSELLDDGSVTVIEWGDVIAPVLPQDYLEVRIRLGDDDDARVLDIEPVGQRWSARMRALTTALHPWIEGAA
jgi:tRNA threonylcarbamoyladenosine biosynthesis protein TsaE